MFTTDKIGLEMIALARHLDDCPNEVYESLLEEIIEEISCSGSIKLDTF